MTTPGFYTWCGVPTVSDHMAGIEGVVRGMQSGNNYSHPGGADDDVNALIGKSLGAFRVVDRIGAGGMATVFKAYQPTLDRYVAI